MSQLAAKPLPNPNRKKIAIGMRKHLKNMNPEALEATLKKRRECIQKAQEIVVTLIEPKVDQSWMLENLIYINQTHFDDVIEERFVSLLCGYPLCGNYLNDVPKQQYTISTKTNKVYDITKRKKYCSSFCYKASNYIRDQMYVSPIWLREFEECVQFELYEEPSLSGSTGVEMDIRLTEQTNSSPTDIKQVEKRVLQEDCKILKGKDELTAKLKENYNNQLEEGCKVNTSLIEVVNIGKIDMRASTAEAMPKHIKKGRGNVGDFSNISKDRVDFSLRDVVINIEKKMREWITVETLHFLLGEDIVRKMFEEVGIDMREKQNLHYNERYSELCDELTTTGLIEESSNSVHISTKKQPDFEKLKEEAKDLEIKVREFYTGGKKVTFKEVCEEEDGEKEPVLPLVHHRATRTTRSTILLNELSTVMMDIQTLIGLPPNLDITGELRALVATFNLGPNNILFRPSEHDLVSVMIMKLLSIRNEYFNSLLNSKQVSESIEHILTTFELDAGYLDRLVSYLTDIGPLNSKVSVEQ